MLHDPFSPKGAISWIVLGFAAAGVALLVGAVFPKIIPARAASVKL